MEWVSDHLKEKFSNGCHRGAVVASFPRQRSVVCLPSEWRVLSKRRSAFSSSRKQIRLSRCSVLFEGDSTLIRPLLRTFDGGFDSFKRVGVCVKEKVQDDHEFRRNSLIALMLPVLQVVATLNTCKTGNKSWLWVEYLWLGWSFVLLFLNKILRNEIGSFFLNNPVLAFL